MTNPPFRTARMDGPNLNRRTTVHAPLDERPTGGEPKATEKQVDFIASLLDRNLIPADAADAIRAQISEGKITKSRASRYLDKLIPLDKAAKADHKAQQVEANRTYDLTSAPEPDAGMYRLEDGTIVRVYLGQQSGKMLAKKLVSDGDHHDYEYMGKATRFVNSNTAKLTLAEAKEFGRMTGHCCVCARRLDVPESVEAGIGPVCSSRLEG